jgi:hypothetical protein
MEITRGELNQGGFARRTPTRTRRQENTGELVQSLMILQERSERIMASLPARLRALHTGFDEDGMPTFMRIIPLTRDPESRASLAEDRQRLRGNASSPDHETSEMSYWRNERESLRRRSSR